MLARLALFAAILAVSLSAPLVRYAEDVPPLTVASLRVALAAVILHAIAPSALRRWLALPRRERRLIALSGALLGAHFGIWISSLQFTSTASAVALVALQPMFAALFGSRLVGDAVARRTLVGIGVAVVGTAVLAGGDIGVSARALFGDALAVAGAATAAAYLVVGRHVRVSLPLAPYLAIVNLLAAAVLLPAALVTGARFTGFAPEIYAAIAACAVVPSLIGHTLLNWSVRRAPAHLVSLAIVGEPVGAILLTWALLGEKPPGTAVIGGVIILAGIYVGFTRPRPGPQAAVVAEPADEDPA
jgi:drug/metabolite transporter (DMT)-like permease